MEQINNRHYLKSLVKKSHINGMQMIENIDSIPTSELDINLPFKLATTGHKRSGKYLNIDKMQKKWKKKKKERRESSTDEENESSC